MKDVLRSNKVLEKYKARKESGETLRLDLRKLKIIKQFSHWVLVDNEFPYDRIAKVHHLLLPIQEFTMEHEMNRHEREELTNIRKWSDENGYDVMMENMSHRRTVKRQFHLHLIKYK